MKIKDKWLIEEVFSSDNCRHQTQEISSETKRWQKTCRLRSFKCNKENCPLKVDKWSDK